MVVAMLDDDRLIVERQWRHPIGKALLEFPAGKLEAGEPVIACAVRELFEETGYRAAEWARAGLTHNAIAYATEGIEIWFARGLTAGERQLDAGEFLDVLEASGRGARGGGPDRRADRREDPDRPALAAQLAGRPMAAAVAAGARLTACG